MQIRKKGQAVIQYWGYEVDCEGEYDKRQSAYAKVTGIENQQIFFVKNLSYKDKEKYPDRSIINVEYAEYHYLCVKIIDIRFVEEDNH